MHIKKSSKLNLSLYLSLFKIIKIASEDKFNKLIFLVFLFVINGFAELISLASFLPFISILSNPNEIPDSPYFNLILNLFRVESEQIIFVTTIIFISLIIISLSIRIYTLRYGLNLTVELGTNLSAKAFKNTIYQPYVVQTTKNSGQIVNTLTIEIDNAVKAISILVKISTALFTFSFIVIGLLFLNPFITPLFIFLFGGAYLLIGKKSSMRLKNYSFIHTEKNTKIIKQIQETLGSIRDIIIDNNHRYYASIYRKMQNKKRGTTAEIDFISTYPAYTLEALAFLIFAFLGIILTFTVDQTSTTLSLLGTLAIGSQKLLRSMQQIYGGISRIKGKSASFEVVLEIFKRELEPSQFVKEKEILDFKSGIKLRNVFFQYDRNLPWTLRDINLNLNKGDIVGLIGQTGTGKSTLIDIIMGLLDPTEGEILIDGKNIKKNMNLKKKWYNSISHVPQDIYLCDGTFSENIALGVSKEEIDIDKVVKAAEIAQIKKDIELYSMKFDTFVGERGIKLSGGQKQRIAIARAIYKQSNVLILDEATSALDNKTELNVINAINELNKDITIIMIAHRLTSLSFCNKIVEIDKGTISSIKNQSMLN